MNKRLRFAVLFSILAAIPIYFFVLLPIQKATDSVLGELVVRPIPELTSKEVATQFSGFLLETQKIELESSQSVYFWQKDLPAGNLPEVQTMDDIVSAEGAIQIHLKIKSEMTPDSFTFSVWNRESSGGNPILKVELEPGEGGHGSMTESVFMPELGEYREAVYDIEGGKGVPELKLEHGIFEKIPALVCATGEFYFTWLGEGSPQQEAFGMIIGDATLVDLETKGLHLKRDVYDYSDEASISRRVDHFWVDARTGRLNSWASVFVDIRKGNEDGKEGHEVYMLVTRDYVYSL